jgi:hypothetical protein
LARRNQRSQTAAVQYATRRSTSNVSLSKCRSHGLGRCFEVEKLQPTVIAAQRRNSTWFEAWSSALAGGHGRDSENRLSLQQADMFGGPGGRRKQGRKTRNRDQISTNIVRHSEAQELSPRGREANGAVRLGETD